MRSTRPHLWYPSQAWSSLPSAFVSELEELGVSEHILWGPALSLRSRKQWISLPRVPSVSGSSSIDTEKFIPWHSSLRKSLYVPNPHFPYVKVFSACLGGSRGSRWLVPCPRQRAAAEPCAETAEPSSTIFNEPTLQIAGGCPWPSASPVPMPGTHQTLEASRYSLIVLGSSVPVNRAVCAYPVLFVFVLKLYLLL